MYHVKKSQENLEYIEFFLRIFIYSYGGWIRSIETGLTGLWSPYVKKYVFLYFIRRKISLSEIEYDENVVYHTPSLSNESWIVHPVIRILCRFCSNYPQHLLSLYHKNQYLITVRSHLVYHLIIVRRVVLFGREFTIYRGHMANQNELKLFN